MTLRVPNRLILSTTILLFAAFTPAFAAPTTYTYTTDAAPQSQNADILSKLGNFSVHGSFQYDVAGDYFGDSGALGFIPGFSVYGAPPAGVQSLSNLSGTIGTRNFSDPTGSVSVSNNDPYYYGKDYLQLSGDAGPKVGSNTYPTDYSRNLAGFNVGQYSLINVRLFWITGLNGATDFISNSQLPSALPGMTGRLALDFVLTSDPHNTANVPFYSNSVFLDGLTVQVSAVPEPETYALLLAGLGLMGAMARRRKALK